jgi:hypothetical protein
LRQLPIAPWIDVPHHGFALIAGEADLLDTAGVTNWKYNSSAPPERDMDGTERA